MIRGKKILITGGAGFVGSHIAEGLCGDNEIILLDNFLSGFKENISNLLKNKNVKFIEGDIRDKEIGKKIGKGVDIVFHEAAQINPAKAVNEPDFDFDINVNGGFNILNWARQTDVKKFLFASTNVYFNPKYVPIDEKHPIQLVSPYAAAKFAIEAYCMCFFEAYGLDTVRLRYTNIYGEGQRSEKSESGVIPIFIKKILANQNPIIFSDGKQTRDFVYVSDVVNANLLAAESKNTAGEVYNIGYGKEISVLDLAKLLIKFSGKDLEPVFGPERAADFKKCIPDISKAYNAFGYRPKVELEDGLRKTLEWWKANME